MAFAMRESRWKSEWGRPYDAEMKEEFLIPLFDRMDDAGQIGKVVVDVGSGARPLSRILSWGPLARGRKFVRVDIAGKNKTNPSTLELRMDIEQVGDPSSTTYKRALLRAGAFFETDPESCIEEQADTMIFSEVLNYVDYRSVLLNFSRFLKPGGRFVIVNKPGRGFLSVFSPKGVENNLELKAFLERAGFSLEHVSFPHGSPEQADAMILLVAVKKEQVDVSDGRLLLAHAVEGAESVDDVGSVDSDDFPIWENRPEDG